MAGTRVKCVKEMRRLAIAYGVERVSDNAAKDNVKSMVDPVRRARCLERGLY